MARPKDVRFYEIPLPKEIPKHEEWLRDYYEHSRQLVDYMSSKEAGSTAYHTTINCLKELKEYLLEKKQSYSIDTSLQWFENNGPYPKGYKITLLRLSDIYGFGEVQAVNAYPIAMPYSKLLQEPWNELMEGYLGTLELPESYAGCVKTRIARFLYKIQKQGISDPSEITFELIEYYCHTEAHRSKKTGAIYMYSIGDILLYMADMGLCQHGLGWYPYFRMHDRIFDITDFTNSQKAKITALAAESMDFPAEDFAVAIELFLNDYRALGYSKSSKERAAYTLHNLLLFLEMNSLGYHKRIAAIWLEHEKTYHEGNGWNQSARVLYQFDIYCNEGSIIPQRLNKTKPVKCESLPDWCKDELYKYLDVKIKEGWASSTIDMVRSSVTRFCEYLVKCDLSGFGQITPEVIKGFNLTDQHSSAEGKNAYNSRIRKFIKYLERKCILPYGIHKALLCSSEAREKLVITLTDDEKQSIMQKHDTCLTAMDLRDNAMILLGMKMGIRSIDIVNLRLKDIDWKRQCIRIYQKKTSHEIVLPMPTEVGNAVYLYIKHGRPNEKTQNDRLFIKHRVPYDSIQRGVCLQALGRALPERNVPGSGFHVTRRTYATDQLRKGTKKQGLADLLGHKDTTSIKHYLNLDDERMMMCPISLSEAGLLMKGGRYDTV
ncbi:tyrosine-type recombinase/integrase [Butyrivibrio sp. INlla14]|uniref:tyrosine-type recombinase/integrase n=1 Tax=Butyrivibrio sp. INlla14 TaxID=1520808 RepID=UPI000876E93A|nr:tyrosine-type recombinase/integrase [Butyrivibrio sp. INlla14]SCX84297.1 Site-specific recombinase XerD [Butyrivibrio sp. INlla14]